MFEYYLPSILTTFQKITPELKNMANLILYVLSLPFFKNSTKNNKGIFLFNNLLFLSDQDKKKTYLIIKVDSR